MSIYENVIWQLFIKNYIPCATVSFNMNSALKDSFSPETKFKILPSLVLCQYITN
jgi:hypothetical protein